MHADNITITTMQGDVDKIPNPFKAAKVMPRWFNYTRPDGTVTRCQQSTVDNHYYERRVLTEKEQTNRKENLGERIIDLAIKVRTLQNLFYRLHDKSIYGECRMTEQQLDKAIKDYQGADTEDSPGKQEELAL